MKITIDEIDSWPKNGPTKVTTIIYKAKIWNKSLQIIKIIDHECNESKIDLMIYNRWKNTCPKCSHTFPEAKERGKIQCSKCQARWEFAPFHPMPIDHTLKEVMSFFQESHINI